MNHDAAAPPSPSGTAVSSTMKLLVDKASQRLLFAEAGKDVVDFIFGLLAMPVGAVASLLLAEDDGASDALGSVASVYASVEKMDAAYMQGTEARDALLGNSSLPAGLSTWLLPTTASAATASSTPAPSDNTHVRPTPPTMPPMPPVPRPPPTPYAATSAPPPRHESGGGVGMRLPLVLPPPVFRCHCHACFALGSSQQRSRGFVQGVASYTVMDDLTVTPASNMSTVALLGSLGVKDLDAVEERTVTVGRKECLEILKAWFKSKTVLTDVFLLAEKKTKKRGRAADDKDDDASE